MFVFRLAQGRQQQQNVEDAIKEMQKPLARYIDDQDLDRMLREQEREGDPMAEFIKKRKAKENKEKKGLDVESHGCTVLAPAAQKCGRCSANGLRLPRQLAPGGLLLWSQGRSSVTSCGCLVTGKGPCYL